MSTLLNDLKESIIPVDEKVRKRAQHHIDQLFKPIGSLGQLEELACQLAAIYRTMKWQTGKKKSSSWRVITVSLKKAWR